MPKHLALVYERDTSAQNSLAAKLSSLGWDTRPLERDLDSIHNVRADIWVVSLVANSTTLIEELVATAATADLLVVADDRVIRSHGQALDHLYDTWPGSVELIIEPFSLAELEMRARWLSQRRGRLLTRSSVIEVGQLRIDTGKLKAWLAGTPIVLKNVEFAALTTLARSAGDVVPKERLLGKLQDDAVALDEGSIGSYISRVRAALKLAGAKEECIRTVHGRGYSLEEPSLQLSNESPTQLLRFRNEPHSK